MTKFSLLQNDDSTLLEKYPAKNDFSPKNVTSHPHPICMTFCLDSWHYIKVHEFATSFYLNWRIYSKIKVEGSHKSYVEDNSRKRSHICADEEMQFWSKQEENRRLVQIGKGGSQVRVQIVKDLSIFVQVLHKMRHHHIWYIWNLAAQIHFAFLHKDCRKVKIVSTFHTDMNILCKVQRAISSLAGPQIVIFPRFRAELIPLPFILLDRKLSNFNLFRDVRK